MNWKNYTRKSTDLFGVPLRFLSPHRYYRCPQGKGRVGVSLGDEEGRFRLYLLFRQSMFNLQKILLWQLKLQSQMSICSM